MQTNEKPPVECNEQATKEPGRKASDLVPLRLVNEKDLTPLKFCLHIAGERLRTKRKTKDRTACASHH